MDTRTWRTGDEDRQSEGRDREFVKESVKWLEKEQMG